MWVLSAACVLAGCRARGEESQLAWVERSSAEALFADASRSGHFQFLAVCGIACGTPALGVVTHAHCYHAIGVRTIDPTGDVIESPRHGHLKDLAAQLAALYNRRLVAWLDSSGARTCGPQERWDELWQALNALAASVPKHPYASFVMMFGDPAREGSDFQLHVQNRVDLTDQLRARVCELIPHFGITARVRFAVTSGNINDHPRQELPLACERGMVAA